MDSTKNIDLVRARATRLLASLGVASLLLSVGCATDASADEPGADESAVAEEPHQVLAQLTDGLAPPGVTAPTPPSAPRAGVAPSSLVPPGTKSFLPHRGGFGGGYFSLDNLGIIYGVRVSSGSYVDSISFAWYRPSGADKFYRAGDPYGQTSRIGGAGGGERGWQYCPAGYAAVGFQGGAGSYVDRIGLVCGRIGASWSTYSLQVWGGGGGGGFFDRCPDNHYLSGVNVRAGSYVDAVQGVCRN